MTTTEVELEDALARVRTALRDIVSDTRFGEITIVVRPRKINVKHTKSWQTETEIEAIDPHLAPAR